MGARSEVYTQVGMQSSWHRPGTVSLAQERLVPQLVSPFITQRPKALRRTPREGSGGWGIGWAAAFKLGKLITLLLTSSWAPPTAHARPYASPFSRVMLFGPHFTGEETEAPRRAETCWSHQRVSGSTGILSVIVEGFLLPPAQCRKSTVLGLAGSAHLALFKVAIICPISRWLQLNSLGMWEDPEGASGEQGVSRGSSLSLELNEHGGHVSPPSRASLPSAPARGAVQASVCGGCC